MVKLSPSDIRLRLFPTAPAVMNSECILSRDRARVPDFSARLTHARQLNQSSYAHSSYSHARGCIAQMAKYSNVAP
eukprot:4178818-Pyramimonas_sp.AAC.1